MNEKSPSTELQDSTKSDRARKPNFRYRTAFLAEADWPVLALSSLVHDYGNLKPSDIVPHTLQALESYGTLFDVKPQPTTNERAIDYQVILRCELNRQTTELKRQIDGAKDETIRALRSECEILRDQNAVLQRLHTELQRQTEGLQIQLTCVSEQNGRMAELLSTKYTARQLLVGSSLLSLGMVLSLAVYFIHGVTVVDPFLAGLTLLGAVGFMGLAGLRARQEKGRE